MFAELGEDGQREGGGLAGAGLGAADDVLAGQDQGNGAQLNGSGLDVAHGLYSIEELIGKA